MINLVRIVSKSKVPGVDHRLSLFLFTFTIYLFYLYSPPLSLSPIFLPSHSLYFTLLSSNSSPFSSRIGIVTIPFLPTLGVLRDIGGGLFFMPDLATADVVDMLSCVSYDKGHGLM
jgi:hypothetical protein